MKSGGMTEWVEFSCAHPTHFDDRSTVMNCWTYIVKMTDCAGIRFINDELAFCELIIFLEKMCSAAVFLVGKWKMWQMNANIINCYYHHHCYYYVIIIAIITRNLYICCRWWTCSDFEWSKSIGWASTFAAWVVGANIVKKPQPRLVTKIWC